MKNNQASHVGAIAMGILKQEVGIVLILPNAL